MKKNDLASTKTAKKTPPTKKPAPKSAPAKKSAEVKPKKSKPVDAIPVESLTEPQTETIAAGDIKALLVGTKPAKMDHEMVKTLAIELLSLDVVHETSTASAGDPAKTTQALVKLIAAYYAARPQIELAKCWKCGLRSDIQFDNCPACGEGEEPAKKSQIIGDKPPVESPESKFTPEDLEAKVSRVRSVMGDVNLSFWHLGSELKELQETQIWKLRKDETGKPLFKSFASFVESEFGVSGKWAVNVISVRTTFDATTIATVGPTKLGILLKVDPETRANLLPEAASISKRDLEAKVREQNGSTSDEPPAPSKPKKAQVVSDDPKIITTVLPTGLTKIPLYQRSESSDLATDIHQNPWGMFECNNGTTIMFRLRLGPNAEFLLEMEPIREA
jgi:hypothetical protein